MAGSNTFRLQNRKAGKLNFASVAEIRALYAEGRCTQGDLARAFGVTAIQIGRIVRGESWQQVPTLPPPITDADIAASKAKFLAMNPDLAAPPSTLDKMRGEIAEKRATEGLIAAFVDGSPATSKVNWLDELGIEKEKGNVD